MAAVGLLLNPPKCSQSDVSYVSYESCELCKKKNQEQMEMYDQKMALLNALGLGEGSRVPRPPSSPPPGVGHRKRFGFSRDALQELQSALVQRKAAGGMIQVMPSKNFKGKAKAEEPARSSLPSSSKARPPMKIYIRKPSSKGAPAPWRRKKNAAKVIFV